MTAPETQNIKPLTSLRFFAALWVVLYTYWPHLEGAIPLGLVAKGYLGVDLFFILSGFIICHVYMTDLGEGRFKYGAFIVNRLARIYPLHLATLGFAIILWAIATKLGVEVDKNLVNWNSFWAHIFMVHAWGFAPEAAFNHPSWSISAEWLAYLLFPVFGAIAWSLRARPIMLVSLSVVLLVSLYLMFQALMGQSLTKSTVHWGALRIIPAFMLGCALFVAWRAGAVQRKSMAMGAAALSSLVVIVSSTYLQSDALIVIALGLMILALAGFSNESLMGNRTLVYLGEVSFAVYMVYVPWKWLYLNAAGMILKTGDGPIPFMWWLAGLLALVPIAMIAHHLVEVPFQKLVKIVGNQIRYWLAYRLSRRSFI
jgi:peptidoglycan/LPS O-acetylase OafA/YrhL